MCFTWLGLGIWQKRQLVDHNEYISMQDCIIVIIVLVFMILSTCCYLRIAASGGRLGQTGRGGGEWQAGESTKMFSRIKSIAYFIEQNYKIAHNCP